MRHRLMAFRRILKGREGPAFAGWIPVKVTSIIRLPPSLDPSPPPLLPSTSIMKWIQDQRLDLKVKMNWDPIRINSPKNEKKKFVKTQDEEQVAFSY